MRALTARLSAGDWVHVFPEGKISKTQKLGSMKWGTAKILCEGDPGSSEPIVLPFYHKGLEKVMPIGTKIPRIGHKNTVVVGRPVDFGDLLLRCRRNHQNKSRREAEGKGAKHEEEKKKYYRDIMGKIEQSLLDLEKECEGLHEKNTMG